MTLVEKTSHQGRTDEASPARETTTRLLTRRHALRDLEFNAVLRATELNRVAGVDAHARVVAKAVAVGHTQQGARR